jgi:hypothetical protein
VVRRIVSVEVVVVMVHVVVQVVVVVVQGVIIVDMLLDVSRWW